MRRWWSSIVVLAGCNQLFGIHDLAQDASPAAADGSASHIDAHTDAHHDGPPGQADAAACVPRESSPNPAHVHTANQDTNAGLDCTVSGCHGAPNAEGPLFVFAGTVYLSDGIKPDPGIAIEVTQNGVALQAVESDTAGNFYYEGGTLGGTMTAALSACPSTTPMIETFTVAGCNSKGCHAQGTTQGVITGN